MAVAQDKAPTTPAPAQGSPTQSAPSSPGAQPQAPRSAQTQQKPQDSAPAPSTITVHREKNVDTDRTATETPVMQMPKLSNQPISKETRVLVMRSLNAETVFARKALPLGQRGVVLKDGKLSPGPTQLANMVATYGPAVKPGDRALITDVRILDRSIIFDLNGGPKKKKKWYQHIEVGGMGGMTPVSRQDPNEENAHGTTVELAFDKFVPEMTGDQVRQLLSPVLDFNAKSAAEAYLETVPPKVKKAITDHQVLVGMNKEMVGFSKGRPDNKVREKDDGGKDYEEWIYGTPPQEVQFIRFNGDEVVQVKVMGVDGQKLVKTEKEVNIENGTATLAKKVSEQEQEDQKAKSAPSLKRPGDEPDKDAPTGQAQRGPTGVNTPTSGKTQQDGEWGKPKTTTPDPNAPKTDDSSTGVPK